MPKTKKKPAPPRAKRGTIGDAVLVRMPADLAEHARQAAANEGLSISEWARRAMHEALLRREARRLGMLK